MALVSANGARRPTKDTDANAVGADVTAPYLIAVVHIIAAVETDDGVAFDLGSISVQEIRAQIDYQIPGAGRRVDRGVEGHRRGDVFTGDPIVPAPRQVRIDRVLGGPIALLGYTPETTIAEEASV